ncbi:MAG: hypothetical protein KDB80_13840 [Planctomycetes bacterium]|nr:hypothetical protein [Planctomycetota bacterium]
MARTLRVLLLGALLCASSSCSTILGTIVSPITGGVDLVRRTQDLETWPLWLPVFIGGAVAGPCVAIYNGVNHDASIFKSWYRYWIDFDEVFRPFEKIGI